MQFDLLLTLTGLTRLEVSLTVSPSFYCSYIDMAFLFTCRNSFFCIPVFCPKLGLYLVLFSLRVCSIICPSVPYCFCRIFHLCCCFSSRVSCFNGTIITTAKLEGPTYCIILFVFSLEFPVV